MSPEFIGAALSRCEKCHRQSAEVIESKRAVLGTRRRKECRTCKHRFTEYEISAAEYRRLIDAATQLEKIRSVLSVLPACEQVQDTGPKEPPCKDCRFNVNGCSFDYPEFNTSGAVDCSLFEPRHDS